MFILGNQLLVKPIPPEEVTKGGIIIPEQSKKKAGVANVVLVSEKLDSDGSAIPEPGDEIVMSPEIGEVVYYNGVEHLIIPYAEVWFIKK